MGTRRRANATTPAWGTTQGTGIVCGAAAVAKSIGRKAGRSTQRRSAPAASTVTLTIPASRQKNASTSTCKRCRALSRVLNFTLLLICLARAERQSPRSRLILGSTTTTAGRNGLSARGVTLKWTWDSDLNGLCSETCTTATRSTRSACGLDKPWWLEALDLHFEFRDMLYRASMMFPAVETDNYGFMAEGLWAMKNGL